MKYAGPGVLIDKPGKDYGPLWEDRYPLAFVFHTTETRGLPGYRNMTINPHLTVDPETQRVWPHVDLDLRVGALRGSNTLYNETGIRSVTNEKSVQIELISYSSKSTADRVGGLWVGNWTDTHYEFVAQVVAWIKKAKGLGDTVTPVPAGGWKYGSDATTRGDHLDFETLAGACAHGFVWGQNHFDTGVLDIERIWTRAIDINKETPPVDIEDFTDAERDFLKELVALVTDSGGNPRSMFYVLEEYRARVKAAQVGGNEPQKVANYTLAPKEHSHKAQVTLS